MQYATPRFIKQITMNEMGGWNLGKSYLWPWQTA